MRRTILPLMLFALVACQPPTTDLTDAEKTAIAEEVNAIHGQFWDVWRAMDVERGMAYYYDSPELTFGMDGSVLWGWGDGMEMTQSFAATTSAQIITIARSQTTVLTPQVVCITDQGTRAITDTAGVTGPALPFAFTAVWVLRDGEWRVHAAHASHGAPEPAE